MEWYIFWDQIVLKMICSDRCTRYWKCCSSWVVSIDLIDGQHLDEWVRITPGGRKCWNITLQDDDIFQLLDRNTHEYFNLQIAFYSTSESSIRYYYTQLNIVEDERGKMHNVKQFCKDCLIIHMKYIKNGSLLTLTANQFCKSLLIASVVKTLHRKPWSARYAWITFVQPPVTCNPLWQWLLWTMTGVRYTNFERSSECHH